MVHAASTFADDVESTGSMQAAKKKNPVLQWTCVVGCSFPLDTGVGRYSSIASNEAQVPA